MDINLAKKYNVKSTVLLLEVTKTPAQVEKEWSKGMMESIGYKYVEALDTGLKKGTWHGVTVHWYKLEQDKLL